MGVERLVLEVGDPAAGTQFLKAIGAEDLVTARLVDVGGSGFRGFSVSLVCAQPADVDLLQDAAVAAGAKILKPATKSFWGYGGIVEDPGGVVWKFAASSKKNTKAPAAAFEDVVLLLGVTDVKASRQFYSEHGLEVAKSFGGKYAEFDSGAVTLALYPLKAAAKEVGRSTARSGSRGLIVTGTIGDFTDPDGYTWQSGNPSA